MTQLENNIFMLTIEPAEGRFSIQPKDPKLPGFSGARVSLRYRTLGGTRRTTLTGWNEIAESHKVPDLQFQGRTEQISYLIPMNADGLEVIVSFGIVLETPLVMWKVEVHNRGISAVNFERVGLLEVNQVDGGSVRFSNATTPDELGFYSNGWQSWSPSGWYGASERMRISKQGGLQHPMIYNPGTPLPCKRGQFSSDMFAVIGDRKARSGFVIGFLSQVEQFGSIYADFNTPSRLEMWANCDDVRLDAGKTITTDWAVFNPILLDHRDPLDKYLEAAARQNDVSVPAESPVGWCSWYHFYTNLSEQDVRNNLQTILEQQETLPIQLVQIDDGFESEVGDWFSFKAEFPQGVAPLAGEITKEGLTPGLWLAPFIVNPRSTLFKEHPEWMLRTKSGKRANAGFGWGTLTTALDLTVPEALAYACSVVRTAAKEWGYPYLKLDFLYAAAVEGVFHDATLTRAQVLRRGMEAIREAVGPQVTLLGCGAPLGSVLGLVEANRIGADVSGDWLPNFKGIGAFFKHEPAMPCARNSIRNILTRATLHQHWWINDPDCLLIRPDTSLTLAEVRSLASAIALTGGSLLVSDDLPSLPAERLRIAEVLVPVIGERARVIDWFDKGMPEKLRLDQVGATGEWHILANFNWSDKAISREITLADYQLNPGRYVAREFWAGGVGILSNTETYKIGEIPAHGCAVLAVRQVAEDIPVYLGSDLHISQGMEVVEWESTAGSLMATLRLPRKASGSVVLRLPGENWEIMVNDQSVIGKQPGEGVFEIPVVVEGFAHLELRRM
jgi:alpha-galactosidase